MVVPKPIPIPRIGRLEIKTKTRLGFGLPKPKPIPIPKPISNPNRASNFKILSSENVINHGTSLQVRVDNITNMQLHEYLSSAFEGDMLGYLRNET